MLVEVHFTDGWAGHSVAKVEQLTGARVGFLTRYGDAMLVTESSALQDGDLLHVLTTRAEVERVSRVLAADPMPGDSR
jgi:trk system potassium uptake protein TrkA